MVKNAKLDIKSVRWTVTSQPAEVEEFLQRPAFDPVAEKAAARMLAAIRSRGDEAVLEFIEKHDGVKLSAGDLCVTPEEREGARAAVDDDFKRAAREARRRISRFAEAGIRKDWDLIQLTTRGNIMYMKIQLTLHGEGMVTTGSTDGNNR